MQRIFAAGLVVFSALSTAAVAEPLDPARQELVRAAALAQLDDLMNSDGFIYAIQEQNALHAGMTQKKIERFDRIWTQGDSHTLLAAEVMGRQESVMLREFRDGSNGLIGEIIVMDEHGLNVAISDHTTDYWQGDEDKFRQTFLIGPDAVHVGALKRDEDAGRDLVQVSMTVADPETGAAIGAVTIGIDPAKISDKVASAE